MKFAIHCQMVWLIKTHALTYSQVKCNLGDGHMSSHCPLQVFVGFKIGITSRGSTEFCSKRNITNPGAESPDAQLMVHEAVPREVSYPSPDTEFYISTADRKTHASG